jgi:outer membrane lipoprotein LolB
MFAFLATPAHVPTRERCENVARRVIARAPRVIALATANSLAAERRSSQRPTTPRFTPALARAALAAFLVAATCSLTACKTLRQAPPAPAPTESWEVRRTALQQRDRFDLTGRIAVAAAEEGFNAKLRWKQQGARSNLSLDGPLGVGGVRITADGDRVNVVNARGQQLDSEAARTEIATRLGFEPPFQSLRFWVQGVPDPSHPADEVLDAEQRLATLRQDGWQVDYTKYSVVGGQWLPSRMTLKRDDVRVRLVVEGWGS